MENNRVIIVGVLVGVLFLFGMVVGCSSFGTIDPGNRGVVVELGRVTGKINGEGFYLKTPFIQSVVEVTVREHKVEFDEDAATKDLQRVTTKLALNLALDPNRVAEVYQKIGRDYTSVIVTPYVNESFKSVTAQYTAEELISKREEVMAKMTSLIKTKLQPYGVFVASANIVNFSFSDSFGKAIEEKVKAEQDALTSKNKLEQIKYDAQQAVESAKGKAEAMRIESLVIQMNPAILQLRTIEKWDGHLPQVTSGGVPMINLK